MKKKKGVTVALVLPAEPAVPITTTESTAAYLKRMAMAAKAMEQRYGK